MNLGQAFARYAAADPHSAPVTQVGTRALLTLAMLAAIALAFFGMRRAWLGKAKKFAHLPAPESAVPSEAVAIGEPALARFAGTTSAGNWLDRIVVHGLGTPRAIEVQIFDSGIALTDGNDFSLWIPKSKISSVRTGRGLAGDVVEPDGMFIITWTLGNDSLDSGIRMERHLEHERMAQLLTGFNGTEVTQGAGA